MISLMNTASDPAIECHLLPQRLLLTEGLLHPSYPHLLSASATMCVPCQRGQTAKLCLPCFLSASPQKGLLARSRKLVHPAMGKFCNTWKAALGTRPQITFQNQELVPPSSLHQAKGFRLVAISGRKVSHLTGQKQKEPSSW